MQRSIRDKVRQYLSRCVILKDEIDQVVQDLEFIEGGGTIRYCVDCSELYSFIASQVPHLSIDIFDNLSNYEQATIELSILNRIIFKLDTKPILLMPYRLELDTYTQRIRIRAFESIVSNMIGIEDELTSSLETPDATRVIGIVEDSRRSNRALSNEEIETCQQFFMQKLPLLVAIAEERYMKPVRILDQVSKPGVFEELNKLTDKDIEGDQQIVDRWFIKLAKKRGKRKAGTNYLDAKAMAIIAEANKELEEYDTKLRLITRSETMHSILKEELDEGLWDSYSGQVLINPRCFSWLHLPHSDSVSETIQFITRNTHSLDLFLDSTKATELRMAVTVEGMILESMEKAMADYRSNLLVTSALEESETIADSINESQSSVAILLGFLNNQELLLEVIEKNLEELSASFRREHELLSWVLESGNTKSQRALSSITMAFEDIQGHTTLGAMLKSIPTHLMFYSKNLYEKTLSLHRKWDFEWYQALDLFREGFSSTDAYERLLVMAYVLGTLGKWELAERYCKRALLEKDDTPQHEGYYFLAVCKMRYSPDMDRLTEAWHLLDTAESIWRANQSTEDPRYPAERAAILYTWFHLVPTNKKQLEQENPEFTECNFMELSQRALKSATGRNRLRMQLMNYICCHLLYSGQESIQSNKGKIEDYVAQIEEYHKQRQPDVYKWPISIIDTIVWAKYQFNSGILTNTEISNMHNWLRKGSLRIQMTKEEMVILQDHMRILEAVITERKTA